LTGKFCSIQTVMPLAADKFLPAQLHSTCLCDFKGMIVVSQSLDRRRFATSLLQLLSGLTNKARLIVATARLLRGTVDPTLTGE